MIGGRHYFFDGVKSVPLSHPDSGGWLDFFGEDEHAMGDFSVGRAYCLVPYLYRAVDARARAVAGMPWSLYRLGESRPLAPNMPSPASGMVRGMRQRLYLTEVALCVYGTAYWLLETNRAGWNMTPRWVVPTSIVPQVDPQAGLTGFERHWSGGIRQLGLEEVVWFWMPGLACEVGPGVAPAQVALASARLLHHLDRFIEGFFRRGAIRATLLTVEGNPPAAELERLQSWWRRLVSGARNAWESVAVRNTVKPVTIGDGLGDIQNRELTTQAREDVCAALGVPHSLLSADAASYATSQSDRLNFYDQTVVPQTQLIEEVINEHYLARMGLRMEFEPDKLEVYQKAEVEKARSLVTLVQGGLMTVAEAREWLGIKRTECLGQVDPGEGMQE
ncbi:MAG: phage portal protein [Chloroflexaceae bacterium]|nr:phage portal protein [Chloroflexaceae bacterium]